MQVKSRWELVLQKVRTRVKDDLTQLEGKDLAFIFEVFDQTYFGGTLWREVCKNGGTLSFKLSSRKSKKAGHMKQKKNLYEIVLFLPIFTGIFTSPSNVSYLSNGIKCHSRLECLLNVFAHELTHLLISRFCYESVRKKEGPHGVTFKKFVLHLFGQTQAKHSLDDSAGNQDADIKNIVTATFRRNQNHIFKANLSNLGVVNGTILKLNPTRARFLVTDSGKTFTVPYELFIM